MVGTHVIQVGNKRVKYEFSVSRNMIATHRVKDSLGDTIGFMIDNNFYADYIVKENINYIENRKLLKNGVISPDKELSETDYKTAVNK